MSSTRWGESSFGELAFAVNDQPLGHAMLARFAVNTAAVAQELGSTHYLGASALFDTDGLSIGYGPAAIHPLSASAIFDVLVDAPSLKFSHTLTAALTLDVTTALAYLSYTHHLHAAATLDTDALAATLSYQHLLRAVLAVDTPANVTQLRIGHALIAAMAMDTPASASEAADIPAVTILPVIGVVNLIVNPAAASTLEGWAVENGAIIDGFDTDHIWFGDHSVAVEFHNPAIHERAIVATPPGLGFLSYPGSVLWGEGMLAVGAGHTATVNVSVRAQYSDTTIDESDAVAVEITAAGANSADWQRVVAGFLLLDPDLALEQAWFVIEPTGADAFPLVIYVGGAQVEYDSLMVGSGLIVALEAA